MPAETPPADGDLRDRLIAALLASWSIADDPASQAMARKAAERDADTMLAVRDDEVERLRGELAHLRERIDDVHEQRIKAEAAVERVRALRARSSQGYIRDYIPAVDVRAALDTPSGADSPAETQTGDAGQNGVPQAATEAQEG